MREIEFTKDFATRKKGDTWKCDGLLASQLVHQDKVAKYVEPKAKAKRETKKSK